MNGTVRVVPASSSPAPVRFGSTRLLADEWGLGSVSAPLDALLDVGRELPVEWFAGAPGTFLADPFPFGETGVVCEEFEYRSARGRLVAFEVERGELTRRRVVAEDQTHLSYPYLCEHEDALWCVPERSAAGGVHLYRFDGNHLIHERCLIPDVQALDTTVICLAGLWWAFFSDAAGTALGNRLDIWFADALEGPWRPHPSTPVTGNGAVMRPAGTLLEIAGRLIRPAQDSRRTYGRRLLLNEIVTLTPERFEELPLVALEAGAGPYDSGPHTISHRGGRVLIDAKRRRFRADAVLGRASRKLRTMKQGTP